MRFLHPVSLLSFGPRGLPPDFSLEAADCLSLYRAFLSVYNNIDFDIGELHPLQNLPGEMLLKQKDVLHYEKILKAKLEAIVSSSDTQDPSSLLNQIVCQVQDPVLAKIPLHERTLPAPAVVILSRLLGLVADLHKGGDLVSVGMTHMTRFD
jgi:ATP-dependent RNA helicase DDX60